jgi:23S rRNA pseudouridine1911/1915/1917 synthase
VKINLEEQNEDHFTQLVINEEDLNQYKRLDIYLKEKLKEYSRNFIKNIFEQGLIYCNDENIKLALKKMPKVDTEIIIEIPPPVDTKAKPQNIPLEILHEDEYLIIINKPAGLVVHPAPGHPDNTLVNAILYHCKDIKGVGNEKRPGIVHRLDMGTTGVMVVAKQHKCHELLVEMFSKHDILRKYEALTLKSPNLMQGSVDAPIGRSPYDRKKMRAKVRNSKRAVTKYKVLKKYGNFTHIELTLETGRTHQIRVHLEQILKTPIINDYLYSNPKQQHQILPSKAKDVILNYKYPLLHAKELGFIHPITKKDLHFISKPPKIFLDVLDQLKINEEK